MSLLIIYFLVLINISIYILVLINYHKKITINKRVEKGEPWRTPIHNQKKLSIIMQVSGIIKALNS